LYLFKDIFESCVMTVKVSVTSSHRALGMALLVSMCVFMSLETTQPRST